MRECPRCEYRRPAVRALRNLRVCLKRAGKLLVPIQGRPTSLADLRKLSASLGAVVCSALICGILDHIERATQHNTCLALVGKDLRKRLRVGQVGVVALGALDDDISQGVLINAIGPVFVDDGLGNRSEARSKSVDMALGTS